MPGNLQSGSRACAFSNTTKRATGKKAAITCAVIRGRAAMASGFAGRNPSLESGVLSLESTPKDAAAVILLRHDTDPNDPEVFWVRRSEKLTFLGGFYAFPGEQREASDAETLVENCDNQERAAMISCAAREMFEETGVLLARGSETLTIGQRASLLDDLESKRMTWPELLRHYGLYLDARDFTFVGRWVTPPFSPRRFDTCFFLVNCPKKHEPSLTVPPQPGCPAGDPGVE